MTEYNSSIHPLCRFSKSDIDRFFSYVSVDRETGAWLWTGGRTGSGYGAFWWRGETLLAHRVSYEIAEGQIPDGLCVCHKHEVLGRHNVNPYHLFLGTNSDNMRDASKKRRLKFGSDNNQNKLTDAQVDDIRSSSRPTVDEAERNGVSVALISKIRRCKAWRSSYTSPLNSIAAHSMANKTGYRGVRFKKGKYESNLSRRVDGKIKTQYLGRYDSAEEAAMAFDAAAIAVDGVSANVNFPKSRNG